MFSWKALHHHPRYKEESVFILVPFIIVVSQLNLRFVKEVGADSQIRIFSKISLLGVQTEEEILWSSCKVPILTALLQQILYGTWDCR